MPYKEKQKRYDAIRRSVAKNPELYKALGKESQYRRSLRGYNMKRLYGVSIEQFNEMLANQNGVCKICGDTPKMKTRQSSRLHIDHCHKTGKVRGLLCVRCNHMIGYLELGDLTTKGMAYLEENS